LDYTTAEDEFKLYEGERVSFHASLFTDDMGKKKQSPHQAKEEFFPVIFRFCTVPQTLYNQPIFNSRSHHFIE
jgi:hypothetical protein